MSKRENDFQGKLIVEMKKRFDGCLILKNDPNYIQGIPDLIILYKNKWVALECKKEASAQVQPNQPYYVNKMNEMSYANFIFPGNKEEVLDEIQQLFSSRR